VQVEIVFPSSDGYTRTPGTHRRIVAFFREHRAAP
jgi:hypothetical protein